MMESKLRIGDVVRYGDFAWTVQDVRGEYADLVRFEGTTLRSAPHSRVDKMTLVGDVKPELYASGVKEKN